jgi:hypothetical protein
MKTLCGLLGIVWAALLIWLGYTAAPIWTPFLGAIVGVFLYVGYRPASRAAIAYDGIIRTSLTLYPAQLIMSFILYGIGRGAAILLP